MADWILNTNWIVFICSIVVGIILLYLDKQNSKEQNLDIGQILQEMESIEGKYYFPESKELSQNKAGKDIKNHVMY